MRLLHVATIMGVRWDVLTLSWPHMRVDEAFSQDLELSISCFPEAGEARLHKFSHLMCSLDDSILEGRAAER